MLAPTLLAACSHDLGAQDGAPADRAATWRDVAPIFAGHCGGCHQPGGVSGLPLTTWSEVQPARDVIAFEVDGGRMPPWPAGPSDYPFQRDPTLTDDEKDTLLAWIDADAPLGDADPDAAIEVAEPEGLDTVTVSLSLPSPYAPDPSITDDYRCFLMKSDDLAAGFVRGYQISVGNPAVVHHARLSAVYPQDDGATLAALDARDDGPGWSCSDEQDPDYGGPTMSIGGWLPGTGAMVFPDDSGVKLAFGAQFVLVVHYHPSPSHPDPDDTSVQLWTTPSVEHPVDPWRLSDDRWRRPPEQGGLDIPAGDPLVEVSTTEEIGRLHAHASNPQPGGVDVLSVQLHMHKLGSKGSITLDRGGVESTLLSVPRWDFDWQLDYELETPLHLDPGDRITLDCQFDNSAGTADVSWGEDTTDEMCSAALNLMKPTSATGP